MVQESPAPGEVEVAAGQHMATARGLSDLSHQLLQCAAETIEGFEGHPVNVHL